MGFPLTINFNLLNKILTILLIIKLVIQQLFKIKQYNKILLNNISLINKQQHNNVMHLIISLKIIQIKFNKPLNNTIINQINSLIYILH